MNWMLFPTLILTFLLFGMGSWLWGCSRSLAARAGVLLGAAAFALLGLLVPAYYLRWFDTSCWYYQFRSYPMTELTGAAIGFSAGVFIASTGKFKMFTRPMVLALLAFWIALPYLKPIVLPLYSVGPLQDRWRDGVCLQSTGSTCGPSCAATLLQSFGIHATEAEIARKCFTYSDSTESWYLARELREHGLVAEYVFMPQSSGELPVPSIAGVKIGELGHFVSLIAETNSIYITGDPIVGRREYPKSEIWKKFQFTGLFLKVEQPPKQ